MTLEEITAKMGAEAMYERGAPAMLERYDL